MNPKESFPTAQSQQEAPKSHLGSQLKELRLKAFIDEYEELAQDAIRGGWSHERYLTDLTTSEVERRQSNRRQRRIKEARFPFLKELTDFDFEGIPKLNQQLVQELHQGDYLHQASPVILVGAPGLGKSHIAISLGLAACRQGHRVRFHTVTGLVNELHQAQNENRLTRYFDQAVRHKLIVLDELGYIPFSTSGAQLLFQFCSAMHERVSMIITTNLPFGEWGQLFGDERLTTGLLDRMTYKAHILEFIGDSYRFQNSQPDRTQT